jgi:hypothetical protein
VLGPGAVLAVATAEVLQVVDENRGVVDVFGGGQQRLEQSVSLGVHRRGEQRP